MNPRHAAARALVGWYLMTAQPYAPLSQWRIVGTYDHASDCQHRLLTLSGSPKPWSPSSRAINKANAPRLACVSTDDPRLKEK
jgi:hypothetical protein